MKPANYPDLRQLIDKLDKRNRERQAARAIMVGSAVLGVLVLLSPFVGREVTSLTTAVTPQATKPTGATAAPNPFLHARLEARSAIVYDLVTKEVIYEKHATEQMPLASLTKLLTAYAAVSALAPESTVTISAEALNEEGDSGLIEGETFTLTNIAKLALVASSNDAAEALAEAAASKEQMSGKNLLASAITAIGLPQTYAVNGTGLDVSESVSGGYGSAKDVALLAGALLEKAPQLAEATTKTSVSVASTDGIVHTLPNTNQDVVHIPNLLLSKTGFTDLAGGNLAVVYDAGINHPVAIVVLGSSREGRFHDVRELLSLTSAHFAGIDVAQKGSVTAEGTATVSR